MLDGQQRLTSLYIGLTVTYAYKRRRVWLANNDYALPPRRLYLNISTESTEADIVYEFQWRIEKEMPLEQDDPYHISMNGEFWFLVGHILDFSEEGALDEFLDSSFEAVGEYMARLMITNQDIDNMKPQL